MDLKFENLFGKCGTPLQPAERREVEVSDLVDNMVATDQLDFKRIVVDDEIDLDKISVIDRNLLYGIVSIQVRGDVIRDMRNILVHAAEELKCAEEELMGDDIELG